MVGACKNKQWNISLQKVGSTDCVIPATCMHLDLQMVYQIYRDPFQGYIEKVPAYFDVKDFISNWL